MRELPVPKAARAAPGRLDGVLGLAVRRGLGRGVLGGDRRWLLLAGALGGLRLVRRVTRRGPEVAWRAELEPGDRIEISAHRRSGRHSRR